MTELEKLYAALYAAKEAFDADIEAAYKNSTRFNDAYAAVDVAWVAYGAARKAAREAAFKLKDMMLGKQNEQE